MANASLSKSDEHTSTVFKLLVHSADERLASALDLTDRLHRQGETASRSLGSHENTESWVLRPGETQEFTASSNGLQCWGVLNVP
jgi:hypothetical protein